MKIAFVAPSHPYRGGIAHFAARLARELSSGDEVLLVNFRRLYPEFLFPGVTQFDHSASPFDFPSERLIDSINPASWLRAAARVRGWGADAVVFHYWLPFFAPAYRTIAAFAGKAVPLAICHNVIPHDASHLAKLLGGLALKSMKGYVVHAANERERLSEVIPAARVKLGFHPLYDQFPNVEISQTEARRRLGIEEEAKIVLYFGLIRPYKGVDLLVEAASRLDDVNGLKILICGEIYEQRDRLLQKIARVPADRIELIDRYIPNEEVALYFRVADLIALPYRSATQSGVIPIAYACGRPVLATRVGGLTEVVEEGESGYLVEPGDAGEIAAAVRKHFVDLGNPTLEEGITRIRGRLSWGAYASLLRELIREIADDR